MSATTGPGLRDRKKASTRTLIAKVAEEAFDQAGFENVTLEQIAEECMISVSTIHRYFDSKEALALAREHANFEHFKADLVERPGDVLSFWRERIQRLDADTSYQEWLRHRYQRFLAHPALGAHFRTIELRYEEALAQAFAEEAGDPELLEPRLLAAMLISSHSAIDRHWLSVNRPFDPQIRLVVADLVAEFLKKQHPVSPSERPGADQGPGVSP